MSGYLTAVSLVDVLVDLAAGDTRVVLVTQDFGPMGAFTERYPERHFDVGITEQNLVGVAAGLAHAGMRPFVLGMAPFVSMRGFEQIRDDCAYNRNDVKIIAPFGGLEAGAWGATHHAIEDLGLMRTVPGLTVLSPADQGEAERALRAAAAVVGPVYLRLGFLMPLPDYDTPFEIGKAVRLRDGRDLTIAATGGCVATALAAHETLAAEGVRARVLNIHTIKPLDAPAIEAAARETGRLVTVEEHSIHGGLGGAVAEVLAEIGVGRLRRVGVQDVFTTEVAPYLDLLRIYGLDADGVVAAARALIG